MSDHKDDWQHLQEEEAKTWLLEDPKEFQIKVTRELARYPRMAHQMGLNIIDTTNMVVVDVGGGPVGLAHYIPAKKRIILEPLTPQYKTMFPCTQHLEGSGEDMPFEDNSIDLVIITNALDHCQDPTKVLEETTRVLKPYSGFFAHYHAIDNAFHNPHPAHSININPSWLHEYLDDKYEAVWELEYPDVRYSFPVYNEKIGEPAFTGLYRLAVK